jgi:hypothetical protein
MKRLKVVPSSFEDRLEQEALRLKLAASLANCATS